MKKLILFALGLSICGTSAWADSSDQQTSNELANVTSQLAAVTNQLAAVSNQVAAVSNQVSAFTNLLAGVTNAAPVWSKYFHAEIGTVVLNPFTISPYSTVPGTYELKNGSADIRGMVQVVLQDRYAWRNSFCPRSDGTYNRGTNSESPIYSIFFGNTNSTLTVKPSLDLEVEAGYAFGASGSQSSATTGAGDFYGSASLGLNCITYWHGHTANALPFVWTAGPEGFVNFASDAEYSLIHTAEGGGLAYVAGIPWVNNTKLEFKTRVGYAWVDSPDIIGTTTDGNPQVAGTGTTSGDLPEFGAKGAVDIQAELRVPISLGGSNNQFGYLSLGGEAYKFTSNAPDQWSMYAAISFDLDNIVKSVISGFQGSSSL